MKINKKMTIKHMMHEAEDLPVEYEIDLINRTIVLNVPFIDTLQITSFLEWMAISDINEKLESLGKLPLIKNLNNYVIELVVAGKTSIIVQLIERGFEPPQTTLVMKLKEQV
jgi:uncharacterized protein YqcC (DUF446 family)